MQNIMKQKQNNLNKVSIFILALLIAILIILGVSAFEDSVYKNPSVFGHIQEEVEGAWEYISQVKIAYTKGNVGINENNPTEKLVVKGNLKTNSIIFPDGSVQTTGVGKKDSFFCPPRTMSVNWGGDDDENIIHQGCTKVSDNVVRISRPVVCEDHENPKPTKCYFFWGGYSGSPTSSQADKVCALFGYKNSTGISNYHYTNIYLRVYEMEYRELVTGRLYLTHKTISDNSFITDLECNIK